MIEELTPEQDAKLEGYYGKWLAIGLQTGPRDHSVIERALADVYKCGGLKPPKRFVWGGSPVEVARIVDKECGAGAGDPGHACYGTHDASWLGFYDFMRAEMGLAEETKELEGLTEAALAGISWFWPYEDVVYISELPTVVAQDQEGRLHAETGPAIGYSDGTAVWAWHGVQVPEDVIMHPENITVERVRDEANAEVRRVMLERFGQDRYIQELGLRPVHEDETGQLFRTEFKNDPEVLTMVRVVDTSTGRPYFLRVPPDMQTAKEAVAWTFDVPPQEYSPRAES